MIPFKSYEGRVVLSGETMRQWMLTRYYRGRWAHMAAVRDRIYWARLWGPLWTYRGLYRETYPTTDDGVIFSSPSGWFAGLENLG